MKNGPRKQPYQPTAHFCWQLKKELTQSQNWPTTGNVMRRQSQTQQTRSKLIQARRSTSSRDSSLKLKPSYQELEEKLESMTTSMGKQQDELIAKLNKMKEDERENLTDALRKAKNKKTDELEKLKKEMADMARKMKNAEGSFRTNKNDETNQKEETDDEDEDNTSTDQEEYNRQGEDATKQKKKKGQRTSVALNPGKYQLKIWKPEENLLYHEHLARNKTALRNARDSGLSENQLINLFALTLRPCDCYIEEILSDQDKDTLDNFLAAVGRYLSGSPSEMMNNLLAMKRRPGEKLLAFYMRLLNAYAQTGRNPKSAEASSFLFPVVLNSSTKTQKVELIREIETKKVKAVSYELLKDSIIKAEIMDPKGYDEEPAELLYNITTPLESAKPTQEKTDAPQYPQRREQRKCQT
ncbi:unnamed protein product [Oikopleura dioica]|uniref:Uncharacterized protein n=1 Tax=Oikopleura dioica TaxID=34765 RepID=E4XJP0_OIKDI|nr:unnamed protein product [Oikopleura dioica]